MSLTMDELQHKMLAARIEAEANLKLGASVHDPVAANNFALVGQGWATLAVAYATEFSARAI